MLVLSIDIYLKKRNKKENQGQKQRFLPKNFKNEQRIQFHGT